MWQAGTVTLPGIADAVPFFGGEGSGFNSHIALGKRDMVDFSVSTRIILNIVLAGPLQILYAWQRIRNLIPDTLENEGKLQRAKEIAANQAGWHSAELYQRDYESFNRLIRMGYLKFSPTKGKAKLKN